jgi:hypothetical protein
MQRAATLHGFFLAMGRPCLPIGDLIDGCLPPLPASGGSCAPDLAPAIAENASGAMEVSSPAGSQKSHPLPDQIAADQYLASKSAARRGSSGLRVMRREGNTSG